MRKKYFKSIIITGSSSGIGAAAARLFASKGFNITLHGRNLEKLKKVSDECIQLGAAGTHIVQLDLSEISGWVTEMKKREKHKLRALKTGDGDNRTVRKA